MPNKATHIPARRLLLTSRFRYLWAGQVISQVGDGLNKIALLWFVYTLTGSAMKMTVVGVLESVPPVLLSPFLGVFIDRLPKKQLLIGLDLTRAVLITLIPLLYLLGLLNLYGIYGLTFANALVSAAFGPTMAAAIPRMVHRDELTAANGLIQSATTFGVLVGPALGGFLASLMGAQNVLYIDAVTFLFSAACLTLVRVHEVDRDLRHALAHLRVGVEIRQALRYIRSHQPLIFWLMVSSAWFAAGIGAFPIMLPIFAKTWLHVGSDWLGGLWSGLGAGMAVVTIALATVRNKSLRANLWIMGIGTAIAAVALAALTFVQRPWHALVMVILIGAGTGLFTPLLWTMLQNHTTAAVRGRVFTFVATTDMAAATLTMALAGALAEDFGATTSLRTLAGIFLVSAGIMFVLLYRHHVSTDFVRSADAMPKD
ncbi:MAG TPA: MFS transporter [Nevskiaceae bacterium]